MTTKVLFYLGNFLIIASLLSTGLIYMPLVFPSTPKVLSEEILTQGTSISIPAIDARAEIILDVDPFNATEYEKALNKGVAHAKGTAMPWENGKKYLFAHSSLSPWKMTRTNTPFLYLNKLQNDQKIVITHQGVEYEFRVFDKKEVWPQEVEYLVNTSDNVLILQTCTPIGTSLKRLLVFAKGV